MGQLWRSEEMEMIQLYIRRDAAHDTVDELGELGVIQFRDLNPAVNAFQRNFVNEVKRCDEMERKLRFLFEQIRKEERTMKKTLKEVVVEADAAPGPKKLDMDELEAYLEGLEKELRQMNGNEDALSRNYVDLIEMKHVLTKDASFFEQAMDAEEVGSQAQGLRIRFITGVVLAEKAIHFERVLWRALHGNLYFRTEDIEEDILDASSGEPMHKLVFAVFYHGDQAQLKIRKICEAFGARVCACPDTPAARRDMLGQVDGRLKDMELVIERSHEHRRKLLYTVSISVQEWMRYVRKEKSIYNVMNSFNYDVGRACLIAEGWVPCKHREAVTDALDRATRRSGATAPSIMNTVQTKEVPPTYFETNKLTSAFQSIVDAYGVADYQEVNPAVFSVITFPFLFAVMFGDLGHGIMLLGVALALIGFEKKLNKMRLNEIADMLFGGRYLLLLMALFSIYIGLLYNETFCISLDIFKTHWKDPTLPGKCQDGKCVKDTSRTYPFGVDPMWRGAENELFYYNSFKMKFSIVAGVVQMVLGVIMSCFNHIHFKRWEHIFFQFIPELLFMLCIFGYLVALIIAKWAIPLHKWHKFPMLINVVIDMFLKFPSLLADDDMFDGQEKLQNALVIIAVISALTLLFPQPFIALYRHKKKLRGAAHEPLDQAGPTMAEENAVKSVDEVSEAAAPAGEHEEEFVFSDIFIHQAIHTIEYVLGCISNTASYLRLWALSLAHSQLSAVFYEQIFLKIGMKSGSFVLAWVGFGAWGGATIAILLMMEALSAFLHALRLHWVEFQNKFYRGEGYAFIPFSYKAVLSQLDTELIVPDNADE
eukprot:m51a1_g11962 putative vacuolar proton atpase 100-kda subunit (822) ;mRNA; f:798456-801754